MVHSISLGLFEKDSIIMDYGTQYNFGIHVCYKIVLLICKKYVLI